MPLSIFDGGKFHFPGLDGEGRPGHVADTSIPLGNVSTPPSNNRPMKPMRAMPRVADSSPSVGRTWSSDRDVAAGGFEPADLIAVPSTEAVQAVSTAHVINTAIVCRARRVMSLLFGFVTGGVGG
jgi:hypothetical protein